MRFLSLVLLLVLSFRVHSQIKDQDLEGVTIKSKKRSVRAILDSIVKNAPRNYAEPMELAGTYTASYMCGTDTAFYLQQPVYLKKREDFTYGFPQIDSTEPNILKDNIRSKAQWDRVFMIEDKLSPAYSNIMAFMGYLYNFTETKRVLYATDGNEADPHFYLLFRPKGKLHISPLIRPFISSLDKDSLFHYSLLKIRRKGWVVTAHEFATLVNDPIKVQELIHTSSFVRAKGLIDSAKAQPNLRWDNYSREWCVGKDGRYRIHRVSTSDNLLNFSLALFKKFPDPQGYVASSEILYDHEKEVPEKLKFFMLELLIKGRKKY